jgi:FkbH-like protein
LLAEGFDPAIYQSEYNRFYEDGALDPSAVRDFRPDVVYIHTHHVNLRYRPGGARTEADLRTDVTEELRRFQSVWESIRSQVGCPIIQNNFDPIPVAPLGNLDSTVTAGRSRFINELNLEFARFASENSWLLIHDVARLATCLGLQQWYDPNRWFSYKILTTPAASREIAASLAALVCAMRGRARKCLILDLDNTLWGGVIGDDGVNKIQIGKETPLAEAYTDFQRYCLALRERGVVLAVCSKNEEETAKAGFGHPDSVLKLEHFASFKANWEPKPDNIIKIAEELSLGLDSFVFVDDNPAERAIVAGRLPMVAVPEVGSEVSGFASVIQSGRYFEVVSLTQEDHARAEAYQANAARSTAVAKFATYDEYLQSLQMSAEIDGFHAVYFDRITQLTNKTNQFNLTTRRYTSTEIIRAAEDHGQVTLYGRLTDAFGDNGLVSVVIGRMEDRDLHVDLWLMSCRVLKRDMEAAMLDALVSRAAARGASQIIGYYLRSAKNKMVEDHYPKMGFAPKSAAPDGSESVWTLDVSSYVPRNRHIQINGGIQ